MGNVQEKNFEDEKISLNLNILMQSMINTQMSRQYLSKTSENFCLNQNFSSINAICNVSRKRNIDNILTDSAHCFEKNDLRRNVISSSEFFSGKRKTLTNELEQSRNHLRVHSSGIFEVIKKQKMNNDTQKFISSNVAPVA